MPTACRGTISVLGGAAGSRGCWRRSRVELERVADLIVFSHPYLPALLCSLMLHPNLLRMSCDEFADPTRIPKLTRNSEIFAAAHEGVRLATFDSGRNAFGGKIILLATGDRNKSRREVSAGSYHGRWRKIVTFTFQALREHTLLSPPLSSLLSLLLAPGPRPRVQKLCSRFFGI